MALLKDITQDDGVITSYHRVQSVIINTNSHNSIIVVSCINNDIREKEKEGLILVPYQKAITYETSYDPDMSVEAAYDFLKTLDVFKDATDI